MSSQMKTAMVAAMVAVSASAARAQEFGLKTPDLVWRGSGPQSNAGLWMDQGEVSAGDGRRDLIVGAPGGSGLFGHVYVINGGPNRSGELSLSVADTVITGTEAGDLFGSATAAGNVLNTEGSGPRDLVVAAPAAAGGRGIVYLFAGGFTPQTRLTAANAKLRIVGLPGDRLGTALATGDLNGDGYREIIIGAAGSGRVYVINGSATLSGTRDIETQGPDGAIGGTGFGAVLAVGDVTGDGISDVLVGSAALNIVYLYRGGSGGGLPILPDAAFPGATPVDGVGSAIRLGDLDNDGIRDVIIGAPGSNGPGNGRPGAGAVYVMWGSPALASRNLAAADLSFLGAVPGDHLGAYVNSGDINRDSPDDLVALAAGGSSGGGDLEICYGRPRTSFGFNAGNGRRIVDFALPGTLDRRIFGDAQVGAIGSAVVFEVTGEGARDVIVGVPSAQSSAGAVFFLLSPRLLRQPSSLTVVVRQNTTRSVSVDVRNPSVVGITWAATPNSSWITLPSPSGAAGGNTPSPLTIQLAPGALPRGVYTGTVSVRSTSKHLLMSLPVNITMIVGSQGTSSTGDFDGDGTADMTVFRPSIGTWFMRYSATGATSGVQWGSPNDIPVAGDYDGDGITDAAVFRPSNGTWYIRYAATGAAFGFQWGNGNDVPVPADYDGDGMTDIAVFRPSNGTWYIRFSNTGATFGFQWGNSADRPVPGDYDGDGADDIAVFRPSNGIWFIRYATGATAGFQWGNGADIPVPGDYDGDGMTDGAVFRPSDGVWYVRYSRTGAVAGFQWGNGADRPVPGDYDGDGRTDYAVFRPSQGIWYIWYSSTNVPAGYQWGNGNDIPILKRP